jgi:hypothetical protein
MKLINPLTRTAVAWLGTLCAMWVVPANSHAASLMIDGTQHCAAISLMTMDPAGNLTVACQATGAGTTAPVCSSVSVSPASITVGNSVVLSANCTQSPTSYAWSASTGNDSSGAPVSGTGQSVSLAFATTAKPGTYTYSVIASNAIGPSGSVSNSVIVNPAGSGGGSCALTNVVTFGDRSFARLNIQSGSFAAVQLPIGTQDGQYLMLSTVQDLSSPQNLTAQVAISKCPGDFNVPAECQAWGGVWSNGTQLVAGTGTSPVYGGCSMQAGAQYYANVRNVGLDLTNSCGTQFCAMLLQYNSTYR